MSQYIVIRKDGVDLTSFSRNSTFYKVYNEQVYYDRWSDLTIDKLYSGIQFIESCIKDNNKRKLLHQKVLGGCHEYEDRLEIAEIIQQYEEDTEDLKSVKVISSFLIQCIEDSKLNDDVDDKEVKWEWGIF